MTPVLNERTSNTTTCTTGCPRRQTRDYKNIQAVVTQQVVTQALYGWCIGVAHNSVEDIERLAYCPHSTHELP